MMVSGFARGFDEGWLTEERAFSKPPAAVDCAVNMLIIRNPPESQTHRGLVGVTLFSSFPAQQTCKYSTWS